MMPFSWWTLVVPALSSVFGLPVVAACTFKAAFSMVLSGGLYFWGLPTLVSSLTLSNYSKLRTGLISFISIVIFVLYHNFSISSIYSLLWLLPLCIALLGLQGLFIRCLEATFLAHAVGTLLYLPFHITNDAFWTALLPIAFAERLIMAVLMYGCCVLFSSLYVTLNRKLSATWFKGVLCRNSGYFSVFFRAARRYAVKLCSNI